jgi:hypothetical protein
MLSVTTLGLAGEASLFIQADDHSLNSALQQLPVWIRSCEDAPIEVFVQLKDHIFYCPIAQLLKLAEN